ncbi:MAG: Cytochrome [Sphingomonas bacterium]|uniref:cytochrome P450 n=1 Tax=Sphingomonas bacterium TaxID=1895847 RepID=UPI002633E2FF|nr:cytochrome P450 [Sphingomonas bacterium]MDB5703853.1 Cytochrome [Sphingomonas bacterium]
MTDIREKAEERAAGTGGCPVAHDSQGVSLTLTDHEVSSDPYELYAELHAKCPVFREPNLGHYIISGYDDLKAALQNHGDFSAEIDRPSIMQGENTRYFRDVLREKGWLHEPTLQRTDPPRHGRVRKIVNRAFGSAQVRGVAPRVQELANQLIDKFIARGECDFIDEFALPLPGTVIAELIGLDTADWRRYKAWSDNLFTYVAAVLTPEQLREAGEIEVEMQQFLAKQFEERRKEPRDDLLSVLLSTEEGEEPLSMEELQSVMSQLMAGGYETLTSAMSHGMRQWIMFPEVVEELRADRTLVPKFINESLRFESPVQGLYRIAMRDVELHGVTIPKGATVNMRYAAANRDPRQFENPDQFDIHRKNGMSQIAFGAFTHACVGLNLARSELNIAYNTLLDRMENFQLARPLPHPVHRQSVAYIPMKELHIKFDAIKR